ncbi:MAG: hypothetical protein J7M12_05115 [Candidatus Hydrogenedentes bacterium]|nr:hypothetical protein [Candidatus Hydrogenedentota bacterium]
MKRGVVAIVAVAVAMSAGYVRAEDSTAGYATVISKYPVELYGFIKLDASYDTSRTDAGNFNRWVRSDKQGNNDDQFNMTARESRFGLKFLGPDFENGKTSGRVEVDFYEGGAENKNRLMMRHAYMQVDWPDCGLSLLAGQTCDVISPLVPATLNYSVAWWVGDIGYRRPQIRLTKNVDVNDDVDATFQVALARTIGDNSPFGNGADSGSDSGGPSVQGRAALSFPFLADKNTSVGVSGHWGEEEYDYNANNKSEDLHSWSANIDIKMPLSEIVTLSGEAFTGENLDAYLGGIAQGVVIEGTTNSYVNGSGWDPTTDPYVDSHVVETSGGWIGLDIGPVKKFKFGLGAGMDNPTDTSDMPAGSRVQNNSYWGNVRYSVNEAVEVGLELSYWDTQYKKAPDADSVRVQTSFVYKF